MAWAAFLDACVLYPFGTRDLLLRLSERYLYRVLWSEQVLEEMARAIRSARPDLSPEQVDHLRVQMKAAFPEATVSGHERLIPAMTNQEGDRHVLAAAVTGKADVIVTDNIRHFPTAATHPYHIEVQTVDEFLTHNLTLAGDVVVDCFLSSVAELRRPPMTFSEALEVWRRRAPRFAHNLESRLGP